MRTVTHVGRIALSGLLVTLWGCAGAQANGKPNVDYGADAQSNLAKGNEALADGDYLEAQQYFEHVKTKYPFLEASKEAELKLAETAFKREQYAESRDLYQAFVKLHPTHPKVDEAAFQAALTHYKEIPSDFFLIPPSIEKDQSEVRSALRALSEFVRVYPDSSFQPEAKRLIEDVRKRLAQHELYVAEFYKRRDKWAAVAGRLETLAEQYQGLGFDEQALFGLHDAYLKLGDKEKAQGALRRVVERLPGTPAAKRAQSLLGS